MLAAARRVRIDRAVRVCGAASLIADGDAHLPRGRPSLYRPRSLIRPPPWRAFRSVKTMKQDVHPDYHFITVVMTATAFSLWFAITLVDVRFLTLLVLATAGLWWRREGRAAAAASALEDEDLL